MPQLPRSDSASAGVGLLLEAGDAPVGVVEHDAELARVRHPLDRERRDPAGRLMARDELAQVDVGERVAGDDQERVVAEEVGDVAHAAGGAEQLAPRSGRRSRRRSSAGSCPGSSGGSRSIVVEPLAVEQVDDVRHHGPVEDRHHRLGDLVRDRPEPRTESRCEDHGLHRGVRLACQPGVGVGGARSDGVRQRCRPRDRRASRAPARRAGSSATATQTSRSGAAVPSNSSFSGRSPRDRRRAGRRSRGSRRRR